MNTIVQPVVLSVKIEIDLFSLLKAETNPERQTENKKKPL